VHPWSTESAAIAPLFADPPCSSCLRRPQVWRRWQLGCSCRTPQAGFTFARLRALRSSGSVCVHPVVCSVTDCCADDCQSEHAACWITDGVYCSIMELYLPIGDHAINSVLKSRAAPHRQRLSPQMSHEPCQLAAECADIACMLPQILRSNLGRSGAIHHP
jgi:hypothetical protein